MSRGLLAIGALYLCALAQGLTLVSFPASSGVLQDALGVSDAQYGTIFLPQVALAVLGAIAGGALARRVGLKAILIAALVANGLSQALLALAAEMPMMAVFPMLLAGTACLGLGFGLTGAPFNTLPPLLLPRHGGSALVVLHSTLGAGLALGPLIVGALADQGAWQAFPVWLAVICVGLVVPVLASQLPSEAPLVAGRVVTDKPSASPAFWALAAIAVLYAFAEGTFSSWAVLYVRDVRGLPAETAALSLSSFWAALVVGRLVVSAVVLRLPASVPWMALPLLILAAFLALPLVSNPATAIGAYVLAGLACSAFFPLTVAIASGRFPDAVSWVSSMLTAALMTGVGLGSFAVGALKAAVPLETLFVLSAAYPVIILLLIVPVVRARREQTA